MGQQCKSCFSSGTIGKILVELTENNNIRDVYSIKASTKGFAQKVNKHNSQLQKKSADSTNSIIFSNFRYVSFVSL